MLRIILNNEPSECRRHSPTVNAKSCFVWLRVFSDTNISIELSLHMKIAEAEAVQSIEIVASRVFYCPTASTAIVWVDLKQTCRIIMNGNSGQVMSGRPPANHSTRETRRGVSMAHLVSHVSSSGTPDKSLPHSQKRVGTGWGNHF